MAESGSKKDIVLNNLENIKQWTSEGKTMRSIAKALHISPQTLYKYLNSTENGLDDIKKARAVAVDKLEDTIFTSATGFTRTVKKYAKVKRVMYENGKKAEEWEEMQEYEEEIYYPPDTTALIFLLKNWAKYVNEPAMMELRKREVELREKELENKNW